MAELGNALLGLHDPKVERVDVRTDMLDYSFAAKCDELHVLRAVLLRLSSGKDGHFPDLVRTVEDRIISLLPPAERRRVVSMRSEPSHGDIRDEEKSLGGWLDDMRNEGGEKASSQQYAILPVGDTSEASTSPSASSAAKALPPVRGSKPAGSARNANKAQKHAGAAAKESSEHPRTKSSIRKEAMSNRDYFRAWDKYDAEGAEQEIDMGSRQQKERVIVATEALSGKEERAKARRQRELSDLRGQINFCALTQKERVFMAEREKQKGNECFRCGDNEEAVCHYSKCIALDETNAAAYANRAMASIRLNNLEQAVADCTAALDIDPSYWKALARRGVVHHKCGRYDRAIADFETCVEREPEDKQYELLLRRSREKWSEVQGEAQHQRTKKSVVIEEVPSENTLEKEYNFGLEDEVIEEIMTPGAAALMRDEEVANGSDSKPLEKAPETSSSSTSFVKVSIAMCDSDDDADGCDDASEEKVFETGGAEAVEGSSEIKTSDELKEEGNTEMSKGNLIEAIYLYSRAIEVDERNCAARNNRALAHIRMKDWVKAEEDATQCIEIEPGNVKALYRRGVARSVQGGLDVLQLAKEDFRSVLLMEPKNLAAAKKLESCKDRLSKQRTNLSSNDVEKGKVEREVAVVSRAKEGASAGIHSVPPPKGADAKDVGERRNVVTSEQASFCRRDENHRYEASSKASVDKEPKMTTEMETTIKHLSAGSNADATVFLYLCRFNRATYKKVFKSMVSSDTLSVVLRAIEDAFTHDSGAEAVRVLSEVARIANRVTLAFMCLEDSDKARVESLLSLSKQVDERKAKIIRKQLRASWLKQ